MQITLSFIGPIGSTVYHMSSNRVQKSVLRAIKVFVSEHESLKIIYSVDHSELKRCIEVPEGHVFATKEELLASL